VAEHEVIVTKMNYVYRVWQCDAQLDQQTQEIQSRDQKLSQSTHQMASLRAELVQMTANIAQLHSKLDACRQTYNSSAQRCKVLDSETIRLRQQLSLLRQQVTTRHSPGHSHLKTCCGSLSSFWILWGVGKIIEASAPTIRLDATPSGPSMPTPPSSHSFDFHLLNNKNYFNH